MGLEMAGFEVTAKFEEGSIQKIKDVFHITEDPYFELKMNGLVMAEKAIPKVDGSKVSFEIVHSNMLILASVCHLINVDVEWPQIPTLINEVRVQD